MKVVIEFSTEKKIELTMTELFELFEKLERMRYQNPIYPIYPVYPPYRITCRGTSSTVNFTS